jgi:hypothetical protein
MPLSKPSALRRYGRGLKRRLRAIALHSSTTAALATPAPKDWRNIAAQALEDAFRREMGDLMYQVVAGSPEDHREALARAQGSVAQFLAGNEWLQRNSPI